MPFLRRSPAPKGIGIIPAQELGEIRILSHLIMNVTKDELSKWQRQNSDEKREDKVHANASYYFFSVLLG
jgi:hypothetical protein